MIVAMDLNASPVPEEDEDTFEERLHVEEFTAPEERIESGADIARRVPFPLLFFFSLWKVLWRWQSMLDTGLGALG